MYRLFVSWRYLKGRRTNLIGIIGVFVGVGALIMILSIMTGFLEASRQTIRGSLSDVIISLTRDPLSGTLGSMADPAPLVQAVREDPRVESASAHLVWFAMLMGDEGLMTDSQFSQRNGVKLIGIDTQDEFRTTDLRDWLSAVPRFGERVEDPENPFALPAKAPRTGRPRTAVIVGEQLYYTHAMFPGQVINLATVSPSSGRDPIINNREFVVAGTFRSRENEMDVERIYMPREDLARFVAGTEFGTELPGDTLRASEVLLKLKDYARDEPALSEELPAQLVQKRLLTSTRQFQTWEQFRHELLGAIKNERVLMGIMLSLVLLVAGFTIFAILSMMVTEKRRDIGILTALGAPPRGVLALFLLIAFWDAILGAVAGAAAGTWLALHIDGVEQWLSSTLGVQIFDRNVYLFDHIPSVVEPWRVAVISVGALACALLFAAIPAWKAASLEPLDALRHE